MCLLLLTLAWGPCAAGKLAASDAALQEARAELAEAQMAVGKAEGEVQGLSDAYSALESHNYQLEAQLSEPRSASMLALFAQWNAIAMSS